MWNTVLIKCIGKYMWYPVDVIFMSSLVRILMTTFSNFFKVVSPDSRFVYITRGNLHGGFSIRLLFFLLRTALFYSLTVLCSFLKCFIYRCHHVISSVYY